MATLAEKAFIQHLCVADSLSQITQMSLPEDLLSGDVLRAIHRFAIDYWQAESRHGIAPSADVLREHFANDLAEHEIDLDIDPEATLSWSIDILQGAYTDRRWQPWVRKFSTDMSMADTLGKIETIDKAIVDLIAIQSAVTKPRELTDVRSGVGRALVAYEDRSNPQRTVSGAQFGLRLIDEHIIEIRPGELCVIGGTPKVGKTYMLLRIAWTCWNLGLVPVVITMEISVEEAIDRLISIVQAINAGDWQRGQASEEELERLRNWAERMVKHELPFPIIQPELGQRSVPHLVAKAKTLGDVLLIDQTSFIETNPLHARLPRHQQIGYALHELKASISTGKQIPCFLAHQINRDGQKLAEKLGRLEMYHFSESAEVERTADFAFGMFATEAMRDSYSLYMQLLAARRTRLQSWLLEWQPWVGQIDVRNPVRLGQ